MYKPKVVSFALDNHALAIHPVAQKTYQLFIDHLDISESVFFEHHISNPWLTPAIHVITSHEDVDYLVYCDFLNYLERIRQPKKKFLYLAHATDESLLKEIELKAWIEIIKLAMSGRVKDEASLYLDIKKFMPSNVVKTLTGKKSLNKTTYGLLVKISAYKLNPTQHSISSEFSEKSFHDIVGNG